MSDQQSFAAISFFDRAKGSASTDSPATLLADMQPLVCLFYFHFPFSFFFLLIRFLLGSLRKPSFPLRISPLMRVLAKPCMLVQRPKAGKPSRVILDLAPLAPRPRTSGWTNHDMGPPPFAPRILLARRIMTFVLVRASNISSPSHSPQPPLFYACLS